MKEQEGQKKIREDIMTMNFLNSVKIVNPKSQEAQQISSSINLNKIIPRHIIIKLFKSGDKENNLRAVRGEKRHITGRGSKIRMTSKKKKKDDIRFVFENNTKRQYSNILKYSKKKTKQKITKL